MAIDTAEKRRSVAGLSFWVVGPGVTPNSSKDAEWRQQVGWSYSGISAGAPVIVTIPIKSFISKEADQTHISQEGDQTHISLEADQTKDNPRC